MQDSKLLILVVSNDNKLAREQFFSDSDPFPACNRGSEISYAKLSPISDPFTYEFSPERSLKTITKIIEELSRGKF